MSLYSKYRPQSFDEMLGNREAIQSLRAVLSKPDPPRAYLLHGPTGCGKTTLGRIIAKELGCRGNDYREIDSADFRGIDTIRDIRQQSLFRPLEGPCRVWLLDECHQLSTDAQNALLKALEEGAEHVYYILSTTDPQKLLPTIRSRCSTYSLVPLPERTMLKLLRSVVKAEGESLTRELYDQIIRASFGHPRAALQILEQVLAAPEEQRTEVVSKAASVEVESIELCRALLQKAGWKKVSRILKGMTDQDAETIRRQVLGYCQTVLLSGENDWAGAVMEEFIEPFYSTGFPGLVFACYSVCRTEDSSL